VRTNAGPLRTEGGAPTIEPNHPGKTEPCTFAVGAPAPGANNCRAASHRGGAPTIGPNHPGKIEPCTFAVGAPAPGANNCRPGSHQGRCSYNRAQPPRVKSNPAPQSKEHPPRVRTDR